MSSLGITVFGVIALTLMVVMYALERRHPSFVLAFAAGCLFSSAYGFLAGAWPFGVVELVYRIGCPTLFGRPRTATGELSH